MKAGDLIKDFDGYIGLLLTNPRLSRDCEGLISSHMMDGDIYEVVDALMPWGTEQFCTDELEVISGSH
jgi:hypothetical protein